MNKSTTKPKIICILGMHRSGTSMLTRILNLCGLSLGKSEEMFTPTYHNQKGHWENNRFMEINIEIIRFFSNKISDWNTRITFPENWQKIQKIKNIKKRAIKLVKDFDSRYQSWGWKDPRNCITLPFWQEILGNRLKYIIVLRQPIDIANSLLKRNNYPVTQGLLLWDKYMTNAITFTNNLSKYFIVSEQLFSNRKKEIMSLIKFINDKNITYNQKTDQKIKNFISNDHWHNQQYKPILNTDQNEITKLISQLYSQTINELDTLYQKTINNKNITINSQNNKINTIEKSKYYQIYNRILILKHKLKKLIQ